MFYYLAMYSFDSDKPVSGPFATRDKAWAVMRKNAESEQKESETSGLEATLTSDEESGEILLEENGKSGNTLTTWILFEIK